MSIIQLTPDAPLDEFQTTPAVDETIEELRSRRSRIALLEAECAQRNAQKGPPVWHAVLVPSGWGLTVFGISSTLPEPMAMSSLFAAAALAFVAARAGIRASKTVRLASRNRALPSRHILAGFFEALIMISGVAALMWSLNATMTSLAALSAGSAMLKTYAWLVPHGNIAPDPRLALAEAKQELAEMESVFENDVANARALLDTQISQARQAAGVSGIAAE